MGALPFSSVACCMYVLLRSCERVLRERVRACPHIDEGYTLYTYVIPGGFGGFSPVLHDTALMGGKLCENCGGKKKNKKRRRRNRVLACDIVIVVVVFFLPVLCASHAVIIGVWGGVCCLLRRHIRAYLPTVAHSFVNILPVRAPCNCQRQSPRKRCRASCANSCFAYGLVSGLIVCP